MTPAGAKLDHRLGEMIAELRGVKSEEGGGMSVVDKIDMLNQRHAEFEQSLDAKAQKLLERYDEVDRKAAKTFDRRNQVLDVRDGKLDEMEAAIDRLSNLGNSPSSSGSSNGA